MLEMALRYGQALYSLASETNNVSTWQKEIKAVKELLKDNPEFLTILSSAFISLEERKQIVDKTFVSFDTQVVFFIKVILDNNRVNYIFEILESFNSLCNESLGVLEGIIYSVEPLTKENIQKLEAKFSKKENVAIEFKNIIDKSLIGGLKVVISDRIYDDSVKFHLEKMKSALLK